MCPPNHIAHNVTHHESESATGRGIETARYGGIARETGTALETAIRRDGAIDPASVHATARGIDGTVREIATELGMEARTEIGIAIEIAPKIVARTAQKTVVGTVRESVAGIARAQGKGSTTDAVTETMIATMTATAAVTVPKNGALDLLVPTAL